MGPKQLMPRGQYWHSSFTEVHVWWDTQSVLPAGLHAGWSNKRTNALSYERLQHKLCWNACWVGSMLPLQVPLLPAEGLVLLMKIEELIAPGQLLVMWVFAYGLTFIGAKTEDTRKAVKGREKISLVCEKNDGTFVKTKPGFRKE